MKKHFNDTAIVTYQARNRLVRFHQLQLRLIKNSLITASLSSAIPPSIVTYILKKNKIQGM